MVETTFATPDAETVAGIVVAPAIFVHGPVAELDDCH